MSNSNFIINDEIFMKSFWPVTFSVFLFFLFNISVHAQAKPIRVACVGNSITFGAGVASELAYPAQLGKLLGSHYDVKNFGVSARTLLKKGDFPYWKDLAFADAKDFQPQIVIIKLGTNDSKPQNWVYKNEFFSDYVDLVNEFRKGKVKPQIFVSLPCPVYQTAWGIRDSIVRLILPIIDSVRTAARTDLIDFNTPLLGSANLFPDGVHPNAQGYALMAQIAKDAILKSPAGITRFFNSNKSFVEKGESATLYWETSTSSAVTLNGAAVKETDSLVVHPNDATTYSLVAKGTDRSDTVNISLEYLRPGKIKSFYAKPRMIEMGTADSSTIYWTTALESQVFFNDLQVEANGSKTVSPLSSTKYKLTTTGDTSDSDEIEVQVLPAEGINRALDGVVKSSTAATNFSAANAIDGDPNTAWKSKLESSPWIYIDFEKLMDFKRVVLKWGRNYGIAYKLQSISEAGALATIYTQTAGTGGVEQINNLTGSGRYLRLQCTQKFITDSGYVLNEFEVYGQKKTTALTDETESVKEFSLFQNYPNPFNPTTVISYQLAVGSHVTLKIFDILGNEVATLVNEDQPTGTYNVEFRSQKSGIRSGVSAKDGYASGVYFYQLSSSFGGGSFVQTKRMIVLK